MSVVVLHEDRGKRDQPIGYSKAGIIGLSACICLSRDLLSTHESVNQSVFDLYNGAIIHQQVMSQRCRRNSMRSAKCEKMCLEDD